MAFSIDGLSDFDGDRHLRFPNVERATAQAFHINPNLMAAPLHVGAGRNCGMPKRSLKKPAQGIVAPDSSEATELVSNPDERDEITRLAFQFWIERGCPIGTPEQDWFRAEAELTSRASKRRQAAAGV